MRGTLIAGTESLFLLLFPDGDHVDRKRAVGLPHAVHGDLRLGGRAVRIEPLATHPVDPAARVVVRHIVGGLGQVAPVASGFDYLIDPGGDSLAQAYLGLIATSDR